MRRVILSEQGVDSSQGVDVQAASYAYCYLRAVHTMGIDAFHWYRATDTPVPTQGDTSTYGLLDTSFNPKQAWYAFQAADQSNWQSVFNNDQGTNLRTLVGVNDWKDLNPYVIPSVTGNASQINQSFRGYVGPSQTMAGGFVIGGSGTKTVLIRGVGPALSNYGIESPLSDPSITILENGTQIGYNAAWQTASDGGAAAANTAAQVGAFALANGSADSALVLTLSPGTYNVLVNTAGGANSGVALFEVYDAGGSANLLNFSSRGQVNNAYQQNGVGSFTIGGTGTKALLIRAVGPTLANYGVSGYLPDPKITIVSATTGAAIASNTGWGDAQIGGTSGNYGNSLNSYDTTSYGSQVGAFSLNTPTTSSFDSALFVRLAPGSYSVNVSGASGDTGNCLFEVYDAGQ